MAKDSNGTAEALLCTKCEKRPRGKAHDWCNECKAEQQKRYTQDRDDLLERRGFRAGAVAMKAVLLQALLPANPNGRLLVHEVVNFIDGVQIPDLQREQPTEGR